MVIRRIPLPWLLFVSLATFPTLRAARPSFAADAKVSTKFWLNDYIPVLALDNDEDHFFLRLLQEQNVTSRPPSGPPPLPDYTSPPLQDAIDATPEAYRSDEVIDEAREADANGTCATNAIRCQIVFEPDDEVWASSEVGLIIFGGGLVDPRGYSVLADTMVNRYGIPTVMPIFSNDINPSPFACVSTLDRLEYAKEAFPDVRKWVLSGHSLGGVGASLTAWQLYTGNSSNELGGVVMMASDMQPLDCFGITDTNFLVLRDSTIPMASLHGPNDGILNVTRWSINQRFLAENTTYRLDIIGGNHAGFASYDHSLRFDILRQTDGPMDIPPLSMWDSVTSGIYNVAARAGATLPQPLESSSSSRLLRETSFPEYLPLSPGFWLSDYLPVSAFGNKKHLLRRLQEDNGTSTAPPGPPPRPDYTSPPLQDAIDATPEAYRSDEVIDEAREADENGTCATNSIRCQIVFEPDDELWTSSEVGFLFFTGGLVDPRSYSVLADIMVNRYGIPTVMPIFSEDINPAPFCQNTLDRLEYAKETFPNVRKWVYSGHSLGGVGAAVDAWQLYTGNSSDLGGLVMMAADIQPVDCFGINETNILVFRDSGIPMASLVGQNDGVLNMTRWSINQRYLAENTTYSLIINGGNHAGFASYNNSLRFPLLGQTDGVMEIPPHSMWDSTTAAIYNVAARTGAALPQPLESNENITDLEESTEEEGGGTEVTTIEGEESGTNTEQITGDEEDGDEEDGVEEDAAASDGVENEGAETPSDVSAESSTEVEETTGAEEEEDVDATSSAHLNVDHHIYWMVISVMLIVMSPPRMFQ